MEDNTKDNLIDELELEDNGVEEEELVDELVTDEYTLEKPKPKFDETDITSIRWTHQFFYDFQDPIMYDPKLGVHVIIFSGGVGSAKSHAAAHLTWRYALQYGNQDYKICLGRQTRNKVKTTVFDAFVKHAPTNFERDEDYIPNLSDLSIKLPHNGCVVETMFWHNKDWDKFKSRDWIFFHLEEGSENKSPMCYNMILQRLNRYKTNFPKILLITTNPDEPDHWINELISKSGYIDGKSQPNGNKRIHTYYSYTRDNLHNLGDGYLEQLMEQYNERQRLRYLEGKWISIYGEGVYCDYSEANYKDFDYKPVQALPVHLSFDFNVADGKPMSAVAQQFVNGNFHYFKEFVRQSSDTANFIKYIYDQGFFKPGFVYEINGDPAGKNRASSSKGFSDYDIIKEFLTSKGIPHEVKVIKGTYDVKQRHNAVNAYCKNALGQHRLFVYNCPILDKGFKSVKLKPNGKEDDTNSAQHITTAAGYSLLETLRNNAGGSIDIIKF
jgi:hypothetical protein